MFDGLHILIPQELFVPTESSYFEGEYVVSELISGPDIYHFSSPLKWEITISNTGDALLISGTITGKAKIQCARCLDEFYFSLSGIVEGFFLLENENGIPDDKEEDEFDVLPEDKTIDLEPLLRAAILLELPLVPLCKETCEGLCPFCGINLNNEKCSCALNHHNEADDESQNPFSVLKDYPFN